jgi:SAM-dependent methyltransferase
MDIVSDPLRCESLAREQIGLDELPNNLSLHHVRVGTMPDAAARFDLAYAWSVFEHVNHELLVPALRQIHDVLRPGGKIIIQMNPLFYSATGSHLDPWIPGPWAHLIDQDSTYREKMLKGAKSDQSLYEALVRLYGTLNRLTVKDFRLLLDQTGFSVILDKYHIDHREIPAPLLNVYHENVLREQGIAVLAERRIDRPK